MRKSRSTYKSCSDLPLYNFIQVLVNDDKEMLYNRPNKAWYKQADLDAIWDKIFLEYIEESGDSRSKTVLELMKDISVVSNKLNIIQNCINLLASITDVKDYQPTIETLRKYGFRYEFSNETLVNDLNKVVKSARQLIIKREELNNELSAINKTEESKATEKDFYVHLANISEHFINPKETTVMQYIGYLTKFNQKIEQNERTGLNT